MEKRTVEGKRRHDLSKKIWYKKKQKEKIRKELVNGRVLGYPGIRISNYWRIKIETGKTQILIIDGEIIPFRKKSNGYWYNNSTGKTVFLHREKLKLHLGLTEEQMEGYEVHHIDGNPDNNTIMNLQLLTKEQHHKLHDKRSSKSKRHVCIKCGRTYYSSVSSSEYICNRCI